MTITSNSSKFPIRVSPFFLLTLVIIISGLSQGLLLPVLAIFMEERGIPSSVNGMHAAALYVGSFAMTLVAERVLGHTGFKKLLIGGMIAVMVALPIFPLVSNLSIWFVLRLVVGIGDSAIHFTSQLWLLLLSPKERRGRNLSLYGMSYGLGFSFGPFGIRLLSYSQLLPFLLLSILTAVGVLLVILRMPNMYPERAAGSVKETRKYGQIYRLAWFALFTPLLYGYMESTMNSNFPIYGLRIGLSAEQIATLLPFFGIGGLILQLPLGMLSDRYSRKIVLMIAGLGGGGLFLIAPLAENNFWGLLLLFLGAGGLVGSFFSLGLAYTADLLPAALLPAANVIASFHFSLGSILGPNVGGAAMEFISPGTLFILLGSLYVLFTLAGFGFRKQTLEKNENMNRL
ncbi:MFS transporter [Paenibacillus motobuensis]|uniref:MFS transporter n=1 Tax=Paenibacillus TaxID=44249 RepID=UPI0020421681|nr:MULTISPECIES: MFS transporter [Paenibacillus]MCM3039259.1 MFS transporter [Paenibacillus lutimineralis]MCM3646363.1 MFS transporter [Paenibacillus motobuensis]